MPIFEYKCNKCSLIESKLEKNKSNEGYDCKCDGGTMLPIISNVSSPQFKGKGFHKTDYK